MKRRSLLAAAAAAAVFTAAPAIAAPVYSVGTGATYRPFEFQAPSKDDIEESILGISKKIKFE